jgi:hypothetical protein
MIYKFYTSVVIYNYSLFLFAQVNSPKISVMPVMQTVMYSLYFDHRVVILQIADRFGQ